MSTTPFQLSIVTPERTIYEGEVTSVTLPATDGYVGIWANHAPMVAAMRAGVLTFDTVKAQHSGEMWAVGQGFCEVSDNQCIVLVDSAQAEGEIDYDSVRAHLARRKKELREHLADPEFDAEVAEREIEEDEAMLRVGFLRGSRG